MRQDTLTSPSVLASSGGARQNPAAAERTRRPGSGATRRAASRARVGSLSSSLCSVRYARRPAPSIAEHSSSSSEKPARREARMESTLTASDSTARHAAVNAERAVE
uniref:Uncharacterized protein n=1 Tax=Arundo donax TaxID=35708 RepID=A0A0A9H081_ARUDO